MKISGRGAKRLSRKGFYNKKSSKLSINKHHCM